jgi:alkylresorcinol/alkylpyrone synthase
VAWWIFHPGGAKILNTLENSLKLSREQCRWGWDALREHGNMSSASVLFALASFLDERPYKPGDKVFMLGVGPGLMLQCNLFECAA